MHRLGATVGEMAEHGETAFAVECFDAVRLDPYGHRQADDAQGGDEGGERNEGLSAHQDVPDGAEAIGDWDRRPSAAAVWGVPARL